MVLNQSGAARRNNARRAQGGGSVYQSADGTWHASLRLGRDERGRLRRRHVQAASRRQAMRKLELLRAESGPINTVGEWTRAWLELVERTRKPSTARLYATHVNHLRSLASLPLGDLGVDDIEAVYARLAERGRSSHTIDSLHRSLRSCLNEAVRRDLLRRNPVLVARPDRTVAGGEIKPLSVREVRAILDAAGSRRNGARWLIALAVGLRQGEALGLQWDDVNFEEGTLSVRRALQRGRWKHGCDPDLCERPAWKCPGRYGGGILVDTPKSARSLRTVALPGHVVDALAVHRRTQAVEAAAGSCWAAPPPADALHSGSGWVFATRDGRPVNPKSDWSDWKGLLAVAGVRDARVHDARHTAATLLLLAGIQPRTVMSVMGWAHPMMMMRYQHVVEDLQREAAQRVDQLIWPDPL